jgi:hypothetical protein
MKIKSLIVFLFCVFNSFVFLCNYELQLAQKADISPTAIVKDFYKLSLNGKIGEAMALASVEEQEDIEPQSSSSYLNEIKKWSNLIFKNKMKFTNTKLFCKNEGTAIVIAKTRYKNGYVDSIVYRLILKTEGWRIYEYSSLALEEGNLKCQ